MSLISPLRPSTVNSIRTSPEIPFCIASLGYWISVLTFWELGQAIPTTFVGAGRGAGGAGGVGTSGLTVVVWVIAACCAATGICICTSGGGMNGGGGATSFGGGGGGVSG